MIVFGSKLFWTSPELKQCKRQTRNLWAEVERRYNFTLMARASHPVPCFLPLCFLLPLVLQRGRAFIDLFLLEIVGIRLLQVKTHVESNVLHYGALTNVKIVRRYKPGSPPSHTE